MKRRRSLPLALCLSCLLLSGLIPAAQAFIVSINAGSQTLYLRVGDGVYTGNYVSGYDPPSGIRGAINTVSVSVPAAALGNGTSLAMTSDASQAASNYDSYAFCNLPSQVYVGGFNRRPKGNASGNGKLSVDVSIPLTNAGGQTIPFSQISWTSSGNGDAAGTQPFPAGTFTGGSQLMGNFPVNTWRESCLTFSYANSAIVAAGTYTGRVVYTLSVP